MVPAILDKIRNIVRFDNIIVVFVTKMVYPSLCCHFRFATDVVHIIVFNEFLVQSSRRRIY